MAKAEKLVKEHLDIFGKNNFFLEIMDHGMEEERIANRGIIELSKKFDIPLVATNDIHYLKKEHADAHEIMLCIQTQSKLSDENRFRFPAPEFYFKSPDEMKMLFKEVPEAVTNTTDCYFSVARSIIRVIRSPTTDPMEAPIKLKFITPKENGIEFNVA